MYNDDNDDNDIAYVLSIYPSILSYIVGPPFHIYEYGSYTHMTKCTCRPLITGYDLIPWRFESDSSHTPHCSSH